jgi:hypothetical protein
LLTNHKKSACRIGFGGDVEAASIVFSRKAKHGANSGTSAMEIVGRMIAEIESYLSSPMKDAESFWEIQERRSLGELLTLLKAA